MRETRTDGLSYAYVLCLLVTVQQRVTNRSGQLGQPSIQSVRTVSPRVRPLPVELVIGRRLIPLGLIPLRIPLTGFGRLRFA
jgi:hypothetical protein